MRKRHLLWAGLLWVALTVAAYAWALTTNYQPLAAAEEAALIDGAFQFLLLLAIPVSTFVLTVLIYAPFAFATKDPEATGTSHAGKGFIAAWVGISTILAVVVIIHPGLTGIAELQADEPADLTIEVVAQQWRWDLRYVESGVTIEKASEMVLPVDARVHFKITSLDVLHSFWIPAFRQKMDAVPGITTEIWMTPNLIGVSAIGSTSFDGQDLLEDEGLRVQCAELCGTGHARMRLAVAVVSEGDFEDWIEQQASQQEEG